MNFTTKLARGQTMQMRMRLKLSLGDEDETGAEAEAAAGADLGPWRLWPVAAVKRKDK